MPHGGNVNIMTVMGDARMDGLSDAGSTPARSTKQTSRTFCMKESYKKSDLFLVMKKIIIGLNLKDKSI